VWFILCKCWTIAKDIHSSRSIRRVRNRLKLLGARQLASSARADEWKSVIIEYRKTYPTAGARKIVSMLRVEREMKVSE
jgi:hypothetical protein